MVTLAVLQPGYLPWLGYFDQMIRADIFLHYDSAQFDKNGWRNRNRVLTRAGPTWLTVPVSHAFGQAVRDVKIAPSSNWARKHCRTLRESYSDAPCLDDYLGTLESVLCRDWRFLLDLDLALVTQIAGWLSITCETGLVSDFDVPGDRTEKLVALCQAVGADRYLTGDAAAAYIDETVFERAGISIEWQRYRHPHYQQSARAKNGDGFVPFLSIIDLLLNCGSHSEVILRRASSVVRTPSDEPPQPQETSGINGA